MLTRALNSPSGMTMSQYCATDAQRIHQVYAHGRRAFLTGEGHDINPHREDPILAMWWRQGWTEALADWMKKSAK